MRQAYLYAEIGIEIVTITLINNRSESLITRLAIRWTTVSHSYSYESNLSLVAMAILIRQKKSTKICVVEGTFHFYFGAVHMSRAA